MDIVIPVSRSDYHFLLPMIRILQADVRPGVGHRMVCLAADEGLIKEMSSFERGVLDGFFETVISIRPAATGGWPAACNKHFFAAANWCKNEATGPWYWMELDTVPLFHGWADCLEDEYKKSGSMFMGMVVPTRKILQDGGILIDSLDPHMVGTGIYPKDTGGLMSAMRGMDESIPWDIQLRKLMMASCHNSDMMAHRWGTENYRISKDGLALYCDSRKTNPRGADFGTPVILPKAIIHGCKDASLMNLVRASKKSVDSNDKQ